MRLKVCGLRDGRGVDAAVAAGAAFLGFVFHPRSPRAVAPAEARALALRAPPGVAKVGLLVDLADDAIAAILAAAPLDLLQLHGAEAPDRVRAVRARFGLPVIKAVGIGGPEDLDAAAAQGRAADLLLLDARPPAGADRPGGHGRAFDWSLVAGRDWGVPWLLAGGLTPGNVAAALRQSGARAVDVSSGVESSPGVKDPALIAAFAAAAGVRPRAVAPGWAAG